MSGEDGPISHFLRRILIDPSSTKVVTIILSGILIGACSRVMSEWNQIPLLIIFISSLIYSVLTLLVVVLKQRENVSNCGVFKIIFGGNENFNGVQSTMAMLFAMANISGIFLVWASYDGVSLGIASFVNVVFFLIDWYINSQAVPEVKDDLPEPEYSCCTKCIFGGFKKFPIFFNFFQAAFLIESLHFATIGSREISNYAYYYNYCTGFAIGCLTLHTALQFSKKLSKKVSTAAVPAHKWQIYFLIIASFYSFLAIIAFVPIDVFFKVQTKEKIYGNPPASYGYDNNKYFDFYDRPTTSPENDTRPFYFKTGWENHHEYAPTQCPIVIALSSLAFLLSLFRLHPFAMPSSKQASEYANEDAHEPLHDETQATDVIIEKFNNLPTVIEFLQNADEIKKPPILT